MNKLQLYLVDMKYVRNLKNIEKKRNGKTNTILSVSSQTHKQGRPFIGILTFVNGEKYCIPLSSIEEKSKYNHISENITCRKIKDDDGNVIGILNINNMIPVRDEYITLFKIDDLPSDTEKQREYKLKCRKELDWCNKNQTEIIRLASELHRIICNNEPFKKRDICPDYLSLEKECNKAKPISVRNMKKRKRKNTD